MTQGSPIPRSAYYGARGPWLCRLYDKTDMILFFVSPHPLNTHQTTSSDQSTKSAGRKSRKRTRLTGPSTAPSGGGTASRSRGPGDGAGELGWGASVTSVLTEPSAFPTTTLGSFHDASSATRAGPTIQQQQAHQREGGEEGGPAEVQKDLK